jgi:hypothetical protein
MVILPSGRTATGSVKSGSRQTRMNSNLPDRSGTFPDRPPPGGGASIELVGDQLDALKAAPAGPGNTTAAKTRIRASLSACSFPKVSYSK